MVAGGDVGYHSRGLKRFSRKTFDCAIESKANSKNEIQKALAPGPTG